MNEKKREKVIKLATALSTREFKREFSFPFSFRYHELAMYGTYDFFFDI